MLFLWSFSQQLQASTFGSLKNNYYPAYLLFSLACLIGLSFADPFVIAAIELTSSLKIYEYLVYARYRFCQRSKPWVINTSKTEYDICLKAEYRLFDTLQFS
eukprot:gene14137-18967_t